MKVWVPGARGMLGQDLVAQLRDADIPHVATDRELDITDPATVGEFAERERFSHIINCAAFTAVDDAETNPGAHRLNALAPENLGDAATRTGAQVLHFSTDYVFDGAATDPYLEDHPTGPLGAYGRGKLEGETRLRAACEHTHIIRTSWLFGVHGKNFVATMLKLMGEREVLRVVGDQHGRPTHTPSLARAALALVGIGPEAAADAPFGIYHFANAGHTTWHGLATAIHHQASARGISLATRELVSITTAEYPLPAARPAWSVLDTSKIEAVLGRSPISWQDALGEFLDRWPTT